MLVGYMRVSSDSDRQSTDLQLDALLSAGVDARHVFADHASGAKDDRPGLTKALDFVQAGDVNPPRVQVCQRVWSCISRGGE